MMAEAERNTLTWVGRAGIHPIESIDRNNPRPGLRRWNFVNTAAGSSAWRESWAAIHHDGSVSLATAIGGQRSRWNEELPGWRIDSASIQSAASDFMGLVRAVGAHLGIGEYETRVGIEGGGSLRIETVDGHGMNFDETSIRLAAYAPVDTTVLADASPLDFYWQVYGLAEDCINQGGLSNVQLISPPPREG
jgi:hypothetical protein